MDAKGVKDGLYEACCVALRHARDMQHFAMSLRSNGEWNMTAKARRDEAICIYYELRHILACIPRDGN